ncbi:MAG: fructosamine kinase family protein [Gammaproteobacteria bacterium]|nr:fructosamine kinase family protein [Gammaproteobacteria bacterium]
MTFWQQLGEEISKTLATPFTIAAYDSVAGGDISTAYRLRSGGGEYYFIKTHDAGFVEMFAAEAEGLMDMAASKTIRVPQVHAWGVIGQQSYLLMEYLQLGNKGSDELLGRQLAAMHGCRGSKFGWQRNNTIGLTQQDNSPSDNWIEFWRWRRLSAQLALAEQKGYGGSLLEKGQRVLEGFDCLFGTYIPQPSLLHGDLWSGNYGFDENAQPVLFDPATYYGDREADLAMTELFGGFGERFYAAYNEAWPLDEGYQVRKRLYNLYHILNHLNLFGRAYAGQAEQMMDRLLSEIQ